MTSSSQKLKLTSSDIHKIINDRHENSERIEIIFNDLPIYHEDFPRDKKTTHRDYVEDDGREFRWLIIKDTLTNEEYCFNIVYNPDWDSEILGIPESITVVTEETESDLYRPKKEPAPEVPVLTDEQIKDKALWESYQTIKNQCRLVDLSEKNPIPKNIQKEIHDLFKSPALTMIKIREKIIPLCIEYKLEDKSFWVWIQKHIR